MVLLLPDTSGLAQGIQTAGGALGQALAQRGQMQAQEQSRLRTEQDTLNRYNLLGNVLDNVDMSTMEGQQEFIRNGLQSGALDEALNMVKIFQTSQSQAPLSVEETQGMARIMEGLGIESGEASDIAQLYGQSNTGGRTEIIKMAVDRMQRSGSGRRSNEPRESRADVDAQAIGYQFPEVDVFSGLTPKEVPPRQKELFNDNAKQFTEITTKQKGLKNESLRVDLLERYNDSGRLPEGMEKLNINWSTGDIRFPALANAETQGFVKTINDFTVKAKETFGARVTNFELGAFMKRLPTMANNTEGRRLILAQMKAMNDLDELYYDSLDEVYNHYGLRNIDRQQAERIAADLRSEKEDQLKQAYVNSLQAQEVFEAKSVAPEGKIVVRSPEGKIAFVWSDQADKAVEKGFELL